ncbi:MAG: hypothetical protein ABI368_09575 [Jatrophihabitantaceae bacterium]
MKVHSLTAARVLLTAIAVVGLGVDAYVHLDLAPTYDAIKTSTLSQGELFRAEAVVSIVAAIAIAIRPRRYTALLAFIVAASALAVLLIYRYVDVQAIGPIPSMYEPSWYPEKACAGYAEGIAAAASATLLAVHYLTLRPAQPEFTPAEQIRR